MDLADDIACGVPDPGDSIALRLVTEAQFRNQVRAEHCAGFTEARRQQAPGENSDPYEAMISGLFGGSDSRKRWIGRMVGHLITAFVFDESLSSRSPCFAGASQCHWRKPDS